MINVTVVMYHKMLSMLFCGVINIVMRGSFYVIKYMDYYICNLEGILGRNEKMRDCWEALFLFLRNSGFVNII